MKWLWVYPLTLVIGTTLASAQQPPAHIDPANSPDCQRRGAMMCVDAAYEATKEESSISSRNKHADPDAVKALGVKIIFFFSDAPRTWGAAPRNKFCSGTNCIYYLRICTSSARSYSLPGSAGHCDYTYGIRPPGQDVVYPGNVEISYMTPEALQAAEQNVFLALGPDGNKTFVPLTEVKTDASP